MKLKTSTLTWSAWAGNRTSVKHSDALAHRAELQFGRSDYGATAACGAHTKASNKHIEWITLRLYIPEENLVPGLDGLLKEACENLPRQHTTVPRHGVPERGAHTLSQRHECPYATPEAACVQVRLCEIRAGQNFRHASQGFRAGGAGGAACEVGDTVALSFVLPAGTGAATTQRAATARAGGAAEATREPLCDVLCMHACMYGLLMSHDHWSTSSPGSLYVNYENRSQQARNISF